MFLKKLRHYFRLVRDTIRARTQKYLVQREVVKVLQLTHAQELYHTPRNEWALVKAAQAKEIQAVRDGQTMDIVDRRSWAYPYLPEALHRLNQPVLKNTPYNLRRFSETPIPRRGINLIKNALLEKDWQLSPISESDADDPEIQQQIDIGTATLERPNNTDSFRELLEAVLEDVILGGYGCIEPRMTPYWQRPFKMWAVDGSTIRIFLDWTESTPDRPRYAQMTGLKGERGIVTFLDNELLYIRDNVRTSTPFGMGKLEICFNAINAFLGVQQMSSNAGSDQIHKTWLWWEQTVQPGQIQTIRRQIINELEGQAKLALMAGLKKPDVIEVQPVTPEDLLLDWQRFLIEIIAAGFDLSPMAFGQTEKVNKATGQVMADSDFRSAVLPMARRVEEALTYLIHKFMGWKKIKFEFIGLEDPDPITRTMIQQREYSMNAITPNEIRKAQSRPPLPGPWGNMTMYQSQIMLFEAQAKLMGKIAGQGGGGMARMGMSTGAGSSSFGGSGSFGGTGAGMGTSGMNTSMGTGGMSFSAEEVAGMSPEEVSLYQELGLLPQGMALPDAMEQEQPGILETLGKELQEYFDQLHVTGDTGEEEVESAPVTPKQKKDQVRRWEESEHAESLAEKVINRRGVFGPAIDQQYRKNPERGKYPRSGGRYIDPNEDRVKQQRMHYRRGKNNPYS